MMLSLQDYFIELLHSLGAAKTQSETYWNEIEEKYSDKNRHYHNLDHLRALSKELSEVKHEINDWKTIMLSLYYHDIVYSAVSYKNELKSAELAAERLRTIGVSEERIEKCRDQILATKYHKTSEDMDTNYFLDADLAILGSSEASYQDYTERLRKEYNLIPAGIYRKGRMKVVKNFLSRDRIYKTDHFYQKYEESARTNLTFEVKQLQ